MNSPPNEYPASSVVADNTGYDTNSEYPPEFKYDYTDIIARRQYLRQLGLYPDITKYGGLKQKHIDWLLKQGVPISAMMKPEPLRIAVGKSAPGFRFEETDHDRGDEWIVIPELEDCVYWNPKFSKWVPTFSGRIFALGQENIWNAGTYALGNRLPIWSSPLEWLKQNRLGICVIDWKAAYYGLRDCLGPVSVDKGIWNLYKQHVPAPPWGPQSFVMEREAVDA